MDYAIQIVRHAFQPEVYSIVGASSVLGPVFHTAILGIEFEIFMFRFLAMGLTTWFTVTFSFLIIGKYTALDAIMRSVISAASFLGSLLSSIVIHRLFLHRCKGFPGPLGAKISRFYATGLYLKDSRYYKQLDKMHDKYGDFVRTGIFLQPLMDSRIHALTSCQGPREISVLRKSAVMALYGPQTNCSKGTWYGQMGNDPGKSSIHMLRDNRSHRLRRRAWDRAFSIRGNEQFSKLKLDDIAKYVIS
jgi:hypothetical protein